MKKTDLVYFVLICPLPDSAAVPGSCFSDTKLSPLYMQRPSSTWHQVNLVNENNTHDFFLSCRFHYYSNTIASSRMSVLVCVYSPYNTVLVLAPFVSLSAFFLILLLLSLLSLSFPSYLFSLPRRQSIHSTLSSTCKKSLPHNRFFVGCSSLFTATRPTPTFTVLRAYRCKQRLPGP